MWYNIFLYRFISYVLTIIIIVALIGIPTYALNFNDHNYVGTVTDKERVVQEKDSYYLIFLKDENNDVHVVRNVDNLLRFKWDSSDIYGALEVGNTYELNLVGYRIPFISMYENVISYKKV